MGLGTHLNFQSPPVNLLACQPPEDLPSNLFPLGCALIQLILPEHLLGARPYVGTKIWKLGVEEAKVPWSTWPELLSGPSFSGRQRLRWDVLCSWNLFGYKITENELKSNGVSRWYSLKLIAPKDPEVETLWGGLQLLHKSQPPTHTPKSSMGHTN